MFSLNVSLYAWISSDKCALRGAPCPAMCGRFALELDVPAIVRNAKSIGLEIGDVESSEAVKPRLNIAPRSHCWVLVPDTKLKSNALRVMKWSLHPTYTSEPVRYPTFNTRIESLDPLKPTWRCARQYRCVVFMQGYYEWHKDTKLPFYIYSAAKTRNDARLSSESEELMCCLAIWDGAEKTTAGIGALHEPHNDVKLPPVLERSPERIPTFSIITMPAPSKEMDKLHSRTPLIVTPEIARAWMNSPWEEALRMVTTIDRTQLVPLTYHPVSTAVNSVKIESPSLNKKVVEKKITDFFKRKDKPIDSSDDRLPKRKKAN